MKKGFFLKLSFRKKVNLGFLISVIIISLFSVYVVHISNELIRVKELNLKTYEFIEDLYELIAQVKELEIIRRDYYISKKPTYLEAYYYNLVKIQEKLNKLRLEEYFKENEKAIEGFSKIVNRIAMALNCPLECKYNPDTKVVIQAIVRNHFNSPEIESFVQDIENEIQAITSEERFELNEKQEEEGKYSSLINLFIICGSITTILILLILIYLVNKDIIRDRLHLAELRILSITDELTGLNNRRGFIHEGKQKFENALQNKRKMFLYFIDMDGLKAINDTLGHEYGDKAIKALAEILKQSFRLSDVIARLGGDEFAVLMVDEHVTPDVIQQRLQKKIIEYNKNTKEPFKLSISIGYKEFNPENPMSIEEMLHEADKRMYKQKQERKKAR